MVARRQESWRVMLDRLPAKLREPSATMCLDTCLQEHLALRTTRSLAKPFMRPYSPGDAHQMAHTRRHTPGSTPQFTLARRHSPDSRPHATPLRRRAPRPRAHVHAQRPRLAGSIFITCLAGSIPTICAQNPSFSPLTVSCPSCRAHTPSFVCHLTQALFGPELLHGQNAYNCQDCASKQPAIKLLQMAKLPQAGKGTGLWTAPGRVDADGWKEADGKKRVERDGWRRHRHHSRTDSRVDSDMLVGVNAATSIRVASGAHAAP